MRQHERAPRPRGRGAHLYARKKQQNTTQDYRNHTTEATTPPPDALYGPLTAKQGRNAHWEG